MLYEVITIQAAVLLVILFLADGFLLHNGTAEMHQNEKSQAVVV